MSPSHSHPRVLNQRNGWVVRWFHAYWSFIWNWDDSGQWGSPGIPNTGEPALLLCRTYAIIAYVRDNAVCRMPYEICRTGVRILSSIYSLTASLTCSNKTSKKLKHILLFFPSFSYTAPRKKKKKKKISNMASARSAHGVRTASWKPSIENV